MLAIGFDSGGTHTTYALHRGNGPEWPSGNESADSISDARGSKSTRGALE